MTPPVVRWERAGSGYYAVHEARVVAVMFPQAGEGDEPTWSLVNAADTAEALQVPLRPPWEAMPGVEVLIPATEMVEAVLRRDASTGV